MLTHLLSNLGRRISFPHNSRLLTSHATSWKIREELRTFGNGHVRFDPDFSPGVGLITLCNPERHNALCGRMMAELADIVDRLESLIEGKNGSSADNALVGLILTGSEKKSFCAGLDLSVAKDHILEPENGAKMSSLMQNTLYRLHRLPLISVAAIEGHALGGGAELTTACDHRCLASSAKVQFVQVKMATTTGWGGGARLVDIVGRTKALRLLAGSELLSGHHALEIGYADMIAEHGKSVTTALHFLDPIVYFNSPPKEGELEPERKRKSVKAVRNIKKIIAAATDNEHIRRLEYELFRELWGGEENRRAVIGSKK